MQQSFEPDSNSKFRTDVQSPKHSVQRTSTEAGTQTDSSDKQEAKAETPISRRVEPDLNVKAERDLQCVKQHRERIVNEAGMRIERSDKHPETALSSIILTGDGSANKHSQSTERGRKTHFSDSHPQKAVESKPE
jgi:hypothetical protein